jgi:hypothetical protein
MQAKGDLRQKGNALWEAAMSGKMDKDKTKRLFDDFVRELAGENLGAIGADGGVTSTGTRKSKVPQQIIDASAGVTKSPVNVKANAITSTGGNGADEDLRVAVIADGQTVTHGDSINVVNEVARRASGSLPCTGVCVRAKGDGRQIFWHGGSQKVHARVKRSTGIADYGVLYQSADAGVLTNDITDGTGQQVGHWEHWVNQPDGSKPDLAVIRLNIGGPGAIILPVDAEVDDFLYFDGTVWTGRQIHGSDIQVGAVGYTHGGTGLTSLGTAGQIIAVNAGATALEWVDQPTGGGVPVQHRTVAFTGVPDASGVIGKFVVPQVGTETTREISRISCFAGDVGLLDTSTYSVSKVNVSDGSSTETLDVGTPSGSDPYVFATATGTTTIDVSGGEATVTVSADSQWIGHGNLSIEVEIT